MKKIFRKIRLYFINQEIENISFWLATNKMGGLSRIERLNKLKRLKARLEP